MIKCTKLRQIVLEHLADFGAVLRVGEQLVFDVGRYLRVFGKERQLRVHVFHVHQIEKMIHQLFDFKAIVDLLQSLKSFLGSLFD